MRKEFLTWVPGSPNRQCRGPAQKHCLWGAQRYSSISLSNGQPHRKRAGELRIGDAYGYSKTGVTNPGAAILSRRCGRERGRNWGGGTGISQFLAALWMWSTYSIETFLSSRGKKDCTRLMGCPKKKGKKWGKVEAQADLWCCQVPWPDRCATSLSKCCLSPWGCPSLFSAWLVVLFSPIWKDSHVT